MVSSRFDYAIAAGKWKGSAAAVMPAPAQHPSAATIGRDEYSFNCFQAEVEARGRFPYIQPFDTRQRGAQTRYRAAIVSTFPSPP
jgi:hypothetical protein